LCLEEQQVDTAINHFNTILATSPNNPRGWLGCGLVHLYRQQYSEAVDALERAAKLSPNHPGILVTLGWAKVVGQDIKGAETAFRQAIDTNHNFGEAHGGLACVLLFQQKQDEAEQSIKRALRLNPHSFGAIFAKSISLTLQGNKQRGVKMVAELLKQAPREGAPPLIDSIRIFMQQNAPHESDSKPE
jgi:cytochrome c-type biogenesis protein CcmH/NrfG